MNKEFDTMFSRVSLWGCLLVGVLTNGCSAPSTEPSNLAIPSVVEVAKISSEQKESMSDGNQPAISDLPTSKPLQDDNWVAVSIEIAAESFGFLKNAPILYVDGKIAKYYPESSDTKIVDSIFVRPGKHLIEVVSYGTHRIGNNEKMPFPFSIASKDVSVQKNTANTSVRFMVPALYDGEFRFGLMGVNVEISEATIAEHVRLIASLTNENTKLYKEDPVVTALQNAQEEVAARSRPSSLVMVGLPETFGGPRELNARQIQTLMVALKFKYWSDGYPDLDLIIRTSRNKSVSFKEALLQLQGERLRAGRECDKIDEFKGLTRRLVEPTDN